MEETLEIQIIMSPSLWKYIIILVCINSYLQDMTNDIVRFMDEHKITMASIGGHGFGAKLATATAINHMNRFTGVICLEGGPLDHRYYEAYQELVKYVEEAKNINLTGLNVQEAAKKLSEKISCSKWRSIFV